MKRASTASSSFLVVATALSLTAPTPAAAQDAAKGESV
jgi:hypothetical protein